MLVWVTRSEPSATRLARRLKQDGHDVVGFPLFEIRSTCLGPPSGRFDIAIFLSQNAVRMVNLDSLQPMCIIAVGPATKSALFSRGKKCVSPPVANSAGVFSWLEPRMSGRERVLIVSGRQGNRELHTALEQMGCEVEDWFVYERSINRFQIEMNPHIDVIEISSVTALDALDSAFRRTKSATARQQRLAVASERIARHALRLGYRKVAVSHGASPDDYSRLLCNMV